MKLLSHILRLCVAMLLSALSVSMALAMPMATSEVTYFQPVITHFAQVDNVGYAAPAPPLAVSNVAVSGGVTSMQSSAFALHGQETAAAFFGFGSGFDAPNRLPDNIKNLSEANITNSGETVLGQIPLNRYDYATGMEKPVVSNPDLQKLVNKDYRDNATVGSGSTADAVRQEIRTGESVGGANHAQKANEQISKYKDWINGNPNASPQDIRHAENVIIDLDDALATQ